MRSDLQAKSSGWLFMSPLAGAYCGGHTTGCTACLTLEFKRQKFTDKFQLLLLCWVMRTVNCFIRLVRQNVDIKNIHIYIICTQLYINYASQSSVQATYLNRVQKHR